MEQLLDVLEIHFGEKKKKITAWKLHIIQNIPLLFIVGNFPDLEKLNSFSSN